MGKIDLHIHSKQSPDADLPLTELISAAEKAEMDIISVTDHNSVNFHRELSKSKITTNINIIPGIELDCCHLEKNFHLLGYNFDISSTDFDTWLTEFTKREMEAVPLRIDKLQKLGFSIDKNEVYKKAGNTIPQEELMAELILANNDNIDHPLLEPYYPRGNRSDQSLINFFWDYMSHGKEAFVPVQYLDIKEGISLIKDNGGIPILAHPGANFNNNLSAIKKIINFGIEGIEAISTYHTEIQTNELINFAKDNSIFITCGSDFHGRNKPLIKIGCINSARIEKQILSNFIQK